MDHFQVYRNYIISSSLVQGIVSMGMRLYREGLENEAIAHDLIKGTPVAIHKENCLIFIHAIHLYK